jgi:dTDP-4-amino-4,6-dideoxygalactose transaminase
MQVTVRAIDWPTWPRYDEAHEDAVLRVIRSNQLFAATEVGAFENEFKEFVGANYAIGVGNATQGLQLALAALGVGIGDEVIVTPYSWISSASCVLMQNAIPVFVDIESDSFGICPEALEKAITQRTKAVILVHMFGLCSKVEEIHEVCRHHSIALIEDGSHAHGARLRGKHLGTFGRVGVFSLHQRKAISAGDGGVLCTDDPLIHEKIRRLRSFGDKQLSYNYRMTEFAAAIARVGLGRLQKDNDVRRNNHAALTSNLGCTQLDTVKASDNVTPVFYSCLLLINLPRQKQEELVKAANFVGIPLKRTWQPLNKHPHFQRINMINQVAPWDNFNKSFCEPSSLQLLNSQKYQERLLFELDCHPLVDQKIVIEAAKTLSRLAER